MYLRAMVLSCCVATWLLGCQTTSGAGATSPGSTSGAGASVPAPPKPIGVKLRVEAITSKGQNFIDSDEILRSGDRLALHVNVSEPSYVYVGLTASDGTRSLVFPRSGEELFTPGMDHRIPTAGNWFKLDRDAGQEDLFLYASRKPLTNEQTLTLLKDDSAKWRRAERIAPVKKGAKKKQGVKPTSQQGDDGAGPGALSPDTRGLTVVGEEGDIQADKDLTRAHFLIRHQK